MSEKEIPLREQKCGNCFYWRPSEYPRGQCRHELPKREVIRGAAVAVFVPIDSGGWCGHWKAHPDGERNDFIVAPVEPVKQPEPISPPVEPAPQPTITRGGGKPSPQKWKRDPGPDLSQAPPELQGNA